MTAVRVHLLTYRRPDLLPRALASLRAQTLTDWTCEVHNDAPDDSGPAEFVERLADPRVTVRTHPTNWGLVRSFNEVFRHTDSRHLSVLEDDNWWDPDFLETMVGHLDRRPGVSAGWANMRFWHERSDGTWAPDGRCIWDQRGHAPVELLGAGLRSAFAAAHSQGAMLWRARGATRAIVPDWVTPSCMEAVRERLMCGPILFHSRPLGNYAVTLRSTRDGDSGKYARDRALLLASFCAALRDDPAALGRVLALLRTEVPYSGHGVITAGFVHRRARFLLTYARPKDWYYFLRAFVRRPLAALRTLRSERTVRRFAVRLEGHVRAAVRDRTARACAATEPWSFTPAEVAGDSSGAAVRSVPEGNDRA